ncbi:MAG: peptidoglycan bridge formation glycyltransferase FemA/FemB family protein [Chloroflexota bacterium]
MTDFSMHAFQGAGSGWNALIASLPGAHLLQTWEWAQVKAAFGWQPMPLVWDRRGEPGNRGAEGAGVGDPPAAAAMLLRRPVLDRGFVRRLCILYVPKGPLLEWGAHPLRSKVLDDLQALARRRGAILLKIDAEIELGRGYPGQEAAHENPEGTAIASELGRRRWLFSGDQVQFRNTVALDLLPDEATLLARMKQKTRYNIRLAEKKGVTVRAGTLAELPRLYQMYAETSDRDRFVIRKAEYYRKVWGTFLRPFSEHSQPCAEALIAEVDGEPVAAIFVFYFAGRAYYLHGMSRAEHREKMPNHLLQWEAIRRARRRGCKIYDLWGAPDELGENDPMWGVYRFKEGLGGEVVRSAGAWDYPASRLWYPVYTRLVPRLLDAMRARGRRQVREELGGA